MNIRRKNQRLRTGAAVGVLMFVMSAGMSSVVTATDDEAGTGCPSRMAELAATVHFANHGVYPSTLDQLSDDGFIPPNLSPDGLAARSEWWTMHMVASVPPVFSCD